MEERITIDHLIALLEDAKVDYDKFFVKGNKAAATRLRKSLQDVAKLCKTSREQVLEHKKVL